MEDFEITLSCGCIKKGRCWKAKESNANVVILEGMEEHLARYDLFADYLTKYGFDVYGIDTFGQGRNVKEDMSNLGVWPDDGYLKQVRHYNQLVEQLKEKTKKPTYIFSHSMGALMGQSYIEYFPGSIDKIVICGCGYNKAAVGSGKIIASMIVNKKNANEPAKFLAKLMFGSFNKKINNPKTKFDWLSYNEENVNKYVADPLCGFTTKNKFCLEFIKGMKTIYDKKNISNIDKNTRIFIISGTNDPVSNYSKAVKQCVDMYKSAGVNDVSSKIYANMRHEILNEDNWEVVAKDIVEFFSK